MKLIEKGETMEKTFKEEEDEMLAKLQRKLKRYKTEIEDYMPMDFPPEVCIIIEEAFLDKIWDEIVRKYPRARESTWCDIYDAVLCDLEGKYELCITVSARDVEPSGDN